LVIAAGRRRGAACGVVVAMPPVELLAADLLRPLHVECAAPGSQQLDGRLGSGERCFAGVSAASLGAVSVVGLVGTVGLGATVDPRGPRGVATHRWRRLP